MEYGYILKLSSKNLYKEIQLSPAETHMKIGMDVDCDVRLYKENFFEKFDMTFTKTGSGWNVCCSDNVYIYAGDVRKLVTKELRHGDVFYVKYQNADMEVFRAEFLFDFDNENKRYDYAIDISHAEMITIGGGRDCNIVLNGDYTKRDMLVLQRRGQDLQVRELHAQCGAYINGKKITSHELIRDGDFLSIADISFYYRSGVLYTESGGKVLVREPLTAGQVNTQSHYPKFHRSTRIKQKLDDEKIEVLDPPAKPQEPKTNLITRLLPSLSMLIVAGVMAFIGGPTMLIFSGISGVMSIVTAVIGLRDTKKDFKAKSQERIEKYNKYIDNKRTEIEQSRAQEHDVLEDIYISQAEERARFRDFSDELFDRVPEDEDYLVVRLGTGDVAAKQEINYKKQERLELEDDLQLMPEQISEEYKYVHDAPIVCDLKTVNAIGVIGTEADRFCMMKNLVVDLCARHYHTDVKMIFVAESEHKDRIWWLRFLPHVANDMLGSRNIVCNDESKSLIFDYLYKELSARKQAKRYDYNIVVFFYDEYGFKSHPISKFVDSAKDIGVTFVFFGEEKADIPQGCGYLVRVSGDEGTLIPTDDGNEASAFRCVTMPDDAAKSMVALLAPVYTEELSLESTLTKNISLFELLHIIAADDLDLGRRWSTSQVFKSMAAPVGVSRGGVIQLDLHDKAHGPHGLVAGTTGSGKSEILQTYILSMATLFSPKEVGFVIIDFKGGGMANQFKDLPHMMGAITNIDGKEIARSLKSIKAELQKRQRLFADADVNHIDKYIQKYRSGEVVEALPHLIIIVDEFAELKAEQPEFMKELISAARIGRSLGVHLILATQKPSGQVNEQIWSNSRFKLCLKVQSQEDSNEVLKSPLAAEIKEPGRAYLQVGNNEIFELFQSAYSGAPEKAVDSNVKSFSICSLAPSGKRIQIYSQKKRRSDDGERTQLTAIVDYVHDYCQTQHIEKLPDICLPPLPERVDFPEKLTRAAASDIVADIGIYDDPDHQLQDVYRVDLSAQNLMIIGSAQSGKTNILSVIIRNLAQKYSPEEVNIYIIDFASMAMKVFEPLAQVGGVVTSSEDEKLKNLFKLLFEEVAARKQKMMEKGLSSFSAYREAGLTDLPQIVLLIDNLTALKELYFKDDDELLELCREGLSVGISVVVANAQTTGIGYKYLSNFAARIALFCNDSGEYSSLFDHCRERVDDIHGRCLVELDKTHLECQSYLAFTGEREIDRVDAVRVFATQIRQQYPRSRAKRIPLIPEVLNSAYIKENYGSDMRDRFAMVLGLDYGSVSPLTVELNGLGVLAISGREGTGMHNFIRYYIDMMNAVYPGKNEVYIMDGIGKRLAALEGAANVVVYDFMAARAAEMIQTVEQRAQQRYDALASGVTESIADEPFLTLVIDSPDALEVISSDTQAANAYKNLTGKYKSMHVLVLVCSYENTNISYSAPEIVKKVKDARQFLFFDDVANMKIFDLPLAILRNFKKPIDKGDCYYIRDNECRKIKTPRCAR